MSGSVAADPKASIIISGNEIGGFTTGGRVEYQFSFLFFDVYFEISEPGHYCSLRINLFMGTPSLFRHKT